MKSLLKLISWSTILEHVTAALLGALPGMWTTAKNLVADAEARFPSAGSGEDKKAWVKSELATAYKTAKTHVVDGVFGLAVAQLKKTLENK